MREKIMAFLMLAGEVKAIVESPIGGGTKYELIFSKELSETIEAMGLELDWKGRGSNRLSEVDAYAKAVEKKAEELRKIAWLGPASPD